MDKHSTLLDREMPRPIVPSDAENVPSGPLTDPFGRRISYVRVSVTDRCDFRCFYCMSENMSFLPKKDILSLEELERLCKVFCERGVRKIRITGGEPLVRRDIMKLFRNLERYVRSGLLDEVTLTTNGSQLKRYARELYDCGVRRVNISLDTLDKDKFHRITRWGRLDNVLAGIDSARSAGLKVKINTVALRNINDREIPELIKWAHGDGMDITLIEAMPMGNIDEDRTDHYLPLSMVRTELQSFWTLKDIDHQTGGPARYVYIKDTGGRLGMITPLSHNFCESCNRVRVTCTGTLYMCLGQEDAADLRGPLRKDDSNLLLNRSLDEAISRKPKGHDFVINRRRDKPSVSRHMSVTGG